MSELTCFYDYNESLYSRRVKSKSKKAMRVSRQVANASKAKDIRFWSKDEINKKKSRKEGQREQWSKYNKKSKSRDWQHLKSYECVAMYGFGANKGDDEGDDESEDHRSSSIAMTAIVMQKNGVSLIEKSIAVSDLVQDRYRKKARVFGLFKEFHNFDCKFTQFNMHCYDGRLCFIRRLLKCTGVSQHLFSLQYLMKLNHTSVQEMDERKWPEYTDCFRYLLSDLMERGIDNEYVLYVLDEIREAVERQFASDLASAKTVIRKRGQLVELLNESEQLNANVVEVLSTFVMGEKELLTHWKRDEDKLERFYLTHRKSTKSSVQSRSLCWEEERAGHQLMSVLYQSKDMTQFALSHMKKVAQLREEDIGNLKGILRCSWAQFQAYVKQQDEFGRTVKPEMLYNIMLHFMEHADLLADFQVIFSTTISNNALPQSVECAASEDLFFERMLFAVRNSVHYISRAPRNYAVFRKHISATCQEQSRFFQCLNQNPHWFGFWDSLLFVEVWHWVKNSSSSSTCKLHFSSLFYDFMAKFWITDLHDADLKLLLAERALLQCAELIRHNQDDFREAAMRQVDLKRSGRWLPFSNRLSLLLQIEMQMEKRQFQEEMLCLQAQSLAENEQYGIDRYSRRLQSKRKSQSRKFAKTSYNTHRKKSSNARIRRKINKFRSNYLLLAC